MLKISYSKGAQAAPGAPRGLQGPQGPKGRPLGVVRMTLEGTSLRSELTKEFALVLLASSLWTNDELIWECFFALFFGLRTFFFQFDAGSFRRNFFRKKHLFFLFIFLPKPLFKIFPNFDKFALLSHIWSFLHVCNFFAHLHFFAAYAFTRQNHTFLLTNLHFFVLSHVFCLKFVF